ncbi:MULTISPECIES: hypothetical protein [Helicobacter]|uniref:Uncharacterized protein n=1 Tax=Helicobacter hepaticus (strain ATCC 51449 / 3B1) TaxID=235279 RepID=Q7VJI5_HELHP|nr:MULTISPECIES: hypothetical protein [Helicobacter]AAP76855.1 hypothetical protein HH_0258 [Helicobacter hepaticus ATCC 51449]
MQEKFKWGKFILDCLICWALTIASYFIFFIPASLIAQFVRKFLIYVFNSTSYYLGNLNILNDFFFIALWLMLCPLFFFGIWFFLEKKSIIKYKIYNSSFWFVFILSTSFWWWLAYGFATTGK